MSQWKRDLSDLWRLFREHPVACVVALIVTAIHAPWIVWQAYRRPTEEKNDALLPEAE